MFQVAEILWYWSFQIIPGHSMASIPMEPPGLSRGDGRKTGLSCTSCHGSVTGGSPSAQWRQGTPEAKEVLAASCGLGWPKLLMTSPTWCQKTQLAMDFRTFQGQIPDRAELLWTPLPLCQLENVKLPTRPPWWCPREVPETHQVRRTLGDGEPPSLTVCFMSLSVPKHSVSKFGRSNI